jgi:plastocyanin
LPLVLTLSVGLLGAGALVVPGSATSSRTSAVATDGPPVTGHASATRSVAVRNNRFSPKRLTIGRGSKVVWRWKDGGVPHNVTPVRGGRGSGTSSRKGHRFSKSFGRRGTFGYRCTIHPATMRLTLKVR